MSDQTKTAGNPWPEADPEVEAAKHAVVMEMMGIGSVDLRAKRVITALWQRGWRPTDGT